MCSPRTTRKTHRPAKKSSWAPSASAAPHSRGRAIYGDAKREKGVYVAACDVDRRFLHNGLEMMKKDGFDAKGYGDFRELLDDPNINAVTIAVPDHWHALIAIEALRKKKNVYCEKPLTLTIDEGKAVVKVAKETGRTFQTGSMQRSDPRFRLACELVRNGRIGKVKQVETRIGGNPTCEPIPKVAVPEGLNWDFWLGPAPEADYVERRNKEDKLVNCRHPYEFRWFYSYSGGKMTDWGAHHNDIAQWGLGMDHSGPIAVEAEGAEPSKDPNAYNTHPTFKITYTYATGTKLYCSSSQLEGSADPKQTVHKDKDGHEHTINHDNGILFLGEDGKWIFVNRAGHHGQRPEADRRAAAGRRETPVRVEQPHGQLLRVHANRQADDLPGGGRLPLGHGLPHRRHRPAHRQEAGLGPGQGGVRRRGGQHDVEPADAGAVEAGSVTAMETSRERERPEIGSATEAISGRSRSRLADT